MSKACMFMTWLKLFIFLTLAILCFRYRKRKANGSLKTIKELPLRDQRQLRRKWRRNRRNRAVSTSTSTTAPAASSTPSTSNGDSGPAASSIPSMSNGDSATKQQTSGRKKIRRERRQAYRTIEKQNSKIRNLKLQLRKVKRQNDKLEQLNMSHNLCHADTVASPGSKVRALMSSGNRKAITRELMFGCVLSSQFAANVRENSQSQHNKQVLRRIIMGSIMRKYRMVHKVSTAIGLLSRSQGKIDKKDLLTKEARLASVQRVDVEERVKAFYLLDINSTMTAGKRETITLHKVKMQRRYLCDTVANIHAKFLVANPNERISYSLFARLRPFYVISPTASKRNTVQCKMHANCDLKAKKLHTLGVLCHQTSNDIIPAIVCSLSKACMYGECTGCATKMPSMYRGGKRPSTQTEVTYSEWKTIKERRTSIKGEDIVVTIQAKQDVTDTVENLCKSLEHDLHLLLPHQFRITSQYNAIRSAKDTLAEHECVLQIDFSENYACKASSEIQSMHFGASRRQITLHTCHATLKNRRTQCYCTVSEDLRHGPAAIWAHLRPVLKDLRNRGVTCLHFVSDGPVTQYKNRQNFAMLSNAPFEMGFQQVYWNFLEASHGKGPADGVGAAVKNAADRSVAHGHDVLNISQLCDSVRGVNVAITQVTKEDVDEISESIPDLHQLEKVKGCMRIHQIICLKPGAIKHRELSCYCSNDALVSCECHQPLSVHVPVMSFPDNLFKSHPESIMIDHQTEVPPQTVSNNSSAPLLHHYYAVYFTQRSKGTFYIGRLTCPHNAETAENSFKFLERVGNRSEYIFDWPTREDVTTVDPVFIMNEIRFDGPPPFCLDQLQLSETLDRVRVMSSANSK